MKNQLLQKILPVTIEEKGKSFLGIPTLISGGSFSITKLISSHRLVGWIVRNGTVSEWKAVGIIEKNGGTYVYGEYLAGVPLETVFEEPPESLIGRIAALAGALKALTDASIEVSYLAVNSVLFLSDGGVCILPPVLMRELIGFAPNDVKIPATVACNHPDRSGAAKASYFLGALAYRALTGMSAFDGTEEELVRHRIRSVRPVEPVYLNPAVKPEISDFVVAALDPVERRIGLDEWTGALERWTCEGSFRRIDEREAERMKAQGHGRRVQVDRRFERKVYWEKNGVRFAVITGSIVIGLVVILMTLGNTIFKTRATRGMTPLKVAWMYYQSMNKLDVTTMTDCVTGDAGAQDVSAVTNLYVVTRPMSPYDKDTRFVSAEDWNAKGRPKLIDSATLYGLTDLSVYDEKPEPDPVVFAHYDKWFSDRDTSKDDWVFSMVIRGVHIEEKLFFKKDREDWVIYKIERTVENPIPVG
jgi:hypothetical protein